MKKLLIIDFNSTLKAIPIKPQFSTKSTSKHFNTKMIYGMFKMLWSSYQDFRPDEIVCVYSEGLENFRHKFVSTYHAGVINKSTHREDLPLQLDKIFDLFKILGVPVLEKKQFDTLDIIGSILHNKSKGSSTNQPMKSEYYIHLLSCFEPMNTFLSKQLKTHHFSTPDSFLTLGLRGAYDMTRYPPYLSADFAAIVGDEESGVSGITDLPVDEIATLMRQFGGLLNLYQNLDDIDNRHHKQLFLKYKESLLANLRIFQYQRDPEIIHDPELAKVDPKLWGSTNDGLNRFLTSCEFNEERKDIFHDVPFPENVEILAHPNYSEPESNSSTVRIQRSFDEFEVMTFDGTSEEFVDKIYSELDNPIVSVTSRQNLIKQIDQLKANLRGRNIDDSVKFDQNTPNQLANTLKEVIEEEDENGRLTYTPGYYTATNNPRHLNEMTKKMEVTDYFSAKFIHVGLNRKLNYPQGICFGFPKDLKLDTLSNERFQEYFSSDAHTLGKGANPDVQVYIITWVNELLHLSKYTDLRSCLKEIFTKYAYKMVVADWKQMVRVLVHLEILKLSQIHYAAEDVNLMDFRYHLGDEKLLPSHFLHNSKFNDNPEFMEKIICDEQGFLKDIYDPLRVVYKDCALTEVFLYVYLDLKQRPPLLTDNYIYRSIDKSLTSVLVMMEVNGLYIDFDGIKDQLEEKVIDIRKRATKKFLDEIYKIAGKTFNIHSREEVSQLLYNELAIHKQLGVSDIPQEVYGYSVEPKDIIKLVGHDLVQRIIHFLSRLTPPGYDHQYLQECLVKDTNRIEVSYSHYATPCGVVGSHDNLYFNAVINDYDLAGEIRSLFIPRVQGNIFISACYDSLAYRILAHLSNDARLARIFNTDEFLYDVIARHLFEKSPEDTLTKEEMSVAVELAQVYIYTARNDDVFKHHHFRGRSREDWFDSFYLLFPGLKKYLEDLYQRAHEDITTASTLHERAIISVGKVKSSDFYYRRRDLGMFSEIPASINEVLKIAMVRANKALMKYQFITHLVLQRNSEFLFEGPESEEECAIKIIKESLESPRELAVGLHVEINTGTNWEEASRDWKHPLLQC
ncbi:MAG: DNA polymerase [Proteobacteria bacterium]|nr:DNA polymerase [Pseudomonadota bacterium]